MIEISSTDMANLVTIDDVAGCTSIDGIVGDTFPPKNWIDRYDEGWRDCINQGTRL